jgi:hypothetical protein
MEPQSRLRWPPFNEAVLNLLKLDARACEIIARIAEALNDYDAWEPVEPRSGYDRADSCEQIDAFQEVYKALIGDTELPVRLAPLARSREQTQEAIEADQFAIDRRMKRHRRRGTRPSAPVVHLVPSDPGEGERSERD